MQGVARKIEAKDVADLLDAARLIVESASGPARSWCSSFRAAFRLPVNEVRLMISGPCLEHATEEWHVAVERARPVNSRSPRLTGLAAVNLLYILASLRWHNWSSHDSFRTPAHHALFDHRLL